MTEARRISMLIPSSMNKTSSLPRYLSPTRLIRRQPEYHEIDTLQQPNHLDNRIRSRRGEKWRLQRGAGYLPATNGYFSRPPPCSASLVEKLANVLTGKTKSFSSTQLSLKFVQTLVLEGIRLIIQFAVPLEFHVHPPLTFSHSTSFAW